MPRSPFPLDVLTTPRPSSAPAVLSAEAGQLAELMAEVGIRTDAHGLPLTPTGRAPSLKTRAEAELWRAWLLRATAAGLVPPERSRAVLAVLTARMDVQSAGAQAVGSALLAALGHTADAVDDEAEG